MNKYFNFKDKRAITLTLIAIITLLSLIIGATYAYFIASESLLTTSRTLEVTTNENVSVAATGNTTLTMDLNLDDMRKFGTTKTYYATQSGKTEIETIEHFLNVGSNSSTSIYCTYTAVLTNNQVENKGNMIDQIRINGKEDEMVLSFLYNGVVKNTFDTKTAVWDSNNQIKFTGVLEDIAPLGNADLDAKLYLKNLANVDQAPYLANTGMSLNMQLTNINCDSVDAPIIESVALNENQFSVDVTMSEGAYELSSYCIDQVEKSDGQCDWITNNDKSFSFNIIDLPEGTTYVHVKDIRGYIADSAGFDIITSNEKKTYSFDYTGGEQAFPLVKDHEYIFEVWGAQGGTTVALGGYGGYATGYYQALENKKVYLYVGGKGINSGYVIGWFNGGYNGGGGAHNNYTSGYSSGTGGGASDIATIRSDMTITNNRTLRTQESYSSRLIVAGGGGGGGSNSSSYQGGAGGGYVGVSRTENSSGVAGTQSGPTSCSNGNYPSGFGYGGTKYYSGWGTGYCGGAGGAGYYGGCANAASCSAGGGAGGSGYIGGVASNEEVTRKMVCFNCSTTTTENIKTESVSTHNILPISNTPKEGNGYIKITDYTPKIVKIY